MKVTIQKEVLTLTSYTTLSKSSVLYTEDSNGNVKIFLWRLGSCKLFAHFNKNSIAEIEYIEKQIKEWYDKRKSSLPTENE